MNSLKKELKQIEADDQAIQTILLGLPEDIYAAVDSCETAQEIWLRVQQMMKGSDIGIHEKKAKKKHFPEKIASNLKFLNNLQPEWSRHVTTVHQTKDLHTADYTQLYDFLKYNQKEVDELKAEQLAKTQDPLALMENSNNPYAFPTPHQDQSSFNQNYLQQPILNPEDITYPTTAMNMALALMAKTFNLNYSTPTNNNQRISSNPRNRQIAQLGMDMGQDRQMQMVEVNGNQNQIGNGNLVAARAEGNIAGNQIRCYNYRGVGYYVRNCTVRPRRRDTAYLQTQLLIAQKEEAGIQLQVEEYDLMAATADLDEIEEVNANFILMANLQQASTSGTQSDSAPVYDSDGSAENYLQQPMQNPEDITDLTTAMNMALALMAKAFKLNYSTPTNNNQRISSNPRNRQIAQPGMNMGQDRQVQMVAGNGGNQFRQYAGQNAGNPVGYNDVIRNQNQIRNGNLVAVRAEGNVVGHNGNQIRCYNCRGLGHFARDCTVRPKRRDAAYLQTQLLIVQKEEA
nr:hypothetical protein [Tanacetum cinerariifolium]